MMSGDFSKLGRLADRLADLAQVPARVARGVSAELEGEIQSEFDTGSDPYDTPWKPLAPATLDKGRSAPPLTDSATMRSSLVVRPLAGAGVGVTIDPPAGIHQTGWSGKRGSGPARPVLPSRGELPEGWIEIIENAIGREFQGVKRR